MIFRIKHQRIGKRVCGILAVGESPETLRDAGTFIMTLEEFAAFARRLDPAEVEPALRETV